MGTITPAELLRLYTLEQITDQQALGHVLQNLVRMQATLEALSGVEFKVDRLIAFMGMEPEPKKKEKRRDEAANVEDLE
jgi:hypothetical protein